MLSVEFFVKEAVVSRPRPWVRRAQNFFLPAAELRCARSLLRAYDEFCRCLLAIPPHPTREFDRAVRALLDIIPKVSVDTRPGGVIVAKMARDTVYFMAELLGDAPLFNVPVGDELKKMLNHLRQIMVFMEKAVQWQCAGDPVRSRECLTDARRRCRDTQPLYSQGLQSLGRPGSVLFLRKREVYRSLWRLAESLGAGIASLENRPGEFSVPLRSGPRD